MAFGSTLRIAWRNLGRNRRRTALALGAIAIAELVLVFYQGLFGGYFETMLRTMTGPVVGHVQVHAPKWRDDHAPDRVIDRLAERLAALRATPGVTSANARVWAPTLIAKADEGEVATIVGVDLAAERQSGLLELTDLSALPGKDQVLLGRGLARALDAKVGDQLALVGQAADGSVAAGLVTVAAVVDTGVETVDRYGVIMGFADAAELLAIGDAAHELVVTGADPLAAPELAARLAKLPALAGLEVLSWRELAPEFGALIDFLWAYELVIMALVFVAAAASAANTMVMSTFERTHELGMLLALGARPRRIVGLVLTEGVVLGLLGLVVGASAGTALVVWTGNTGIDISKLAPGGGGAEISYMGMKITMLMYPRFDPQGLWRSAVAVFVISLLASLWPAVRAARLEPAEAARA
jgi:ABC-type lipoprotein release transport system permease subunit